MTRTFEQTGNTVADETPDEVAAPDPSELVEYFHPDLNGKRSAVALTTRDAFEKLWGPKGWHLVEDDVAETPEKAPALTGVQSTPPQSGKQDAGNTPPDPGATK